MIPVLVVGTKVTQPACANCIDLSHFIAICRQRCYNGGTCTSPGVCRCADGWGGNNCRKGT